MLHRNKMDYEDEEVQCH